MKEDIQYLTHAIEIAKRSTPFYTNDGSTRFHSKYGVSYSDDMDMLLGAIAEASDVDEPLEGDMDKDHMAEYKKYIPYALAVTRPSSIEEATEHIELMDTWVNVVRRDAADDMVENAEPEAFDHAYLPLLIAKSGGDVYMAATSIHPDRVKAVHGMNDDTRIIEVERTEMYDEYGDAFGFEKLRDVSLAPGSLEAHGVREDVREEILGRSGTITDLLRSIKFHLGRINVR